MEETRQLVVMPQPETAVHQPASEVVVDGRWRIIRARRYGGPVDIPRSVVLPAALVTLAICGGPCLLFLLVEVTAR